VAHLKAQIEQLRADLAAADEALDTAAADAAMLRQKLDEAMASLKSARVQLQAAEDANATLQAKNRALQAALDDASKAAAAAAGGSDDTAPSAADDMAAARLREAVQEAEARARSAGKASAALERKLTQRDQEVAQLRAALAEAQDGLNEATRLHLEAVKGQAPGATSLGGTGRGRAGSARGRGATAGPGCLTILQRQDLYVCATRCVYHGLFRGGGAPGAWVQAVV